MKFKIVHWIVFFILCFVVSFRTSAQTSFTFSLETSARTSAGVYLKDGTLIRTLWSGVTYPSGSNKASWDGKDDLGNLVTGTSYDIKVLSNNVKYQWEGVLGNTSTNLTGKTVHRSLDPALSIAITGTKAYYAVGYGEAQVAQKSFNLATPQINENVNDILGTSQNSDFVVTDGTTVFWAGYDPNENTKSFVYGSKVSDNSFTNFSGGVSVSTKYGTTYDKAIDYVNTANSQPSGMTVQKSGTYLFVAHKGLNYVSVLNKTTGVLVRKLTFTAPTAIYADNSNNIWITYNNNIVSKYKVNSDGSIGSALLTLSGLSSPVGMEGNGSIVAVVDGGTSQQIKAFDLNTGSRAWTLGQAGGNFTSPIVTPDRFLFHKRNDSSTEPIVFGSISFAPDGSFWVVDPGNIRMQHFSANRTFIESISYLGRTYTVSVDQNNPKRVLADFLEFEVDYSKPLASSWVLKYNWGANVTAEYDQFHKIRNMQTLSNGRTYAFIRKGDKNELVEFVSTGLRFTGIFFALDDKALYPDGSIRRTANIGLAQRWYKMPLTGFRGNDPQWGAEVIMETITPGDKEPKNGGNTMPGEVTASGLTISFDGYLSKTDGDAFRLGGFKNGKFVFKTARTTSIDYKGDFPLDGTFDIGNFPRAADNSPTGYAGNRALAFGKNIIWGFHGEFWKNSQTNKYNHVYEDGLFVGQFGATGVDSREAAAPMMAGNALSSTIVEVGGVTYLYHNDESIHAGVHRWKITDLNTIKEQTIPVEVEMPDNGLTGTYFKGSDLNNFNVAEVKNDAQINSVTDASKATSNSAVSSVRWEGSIIPNYTEDYKFTVKTGKGVRVWINDVLVTDSWTNSTLKEIVSKSIWLEAKKTYPIKIEINSTTADISWESTSQRKGIIPSGSLFVKQASDSKGVNLLEGLTTGTFFENGLYGWNRSSSSETTSEDNTWTVKLGSKAADVLAPDMYVTYLNKSTDTKTITRDLGTVSSDLTSWKLKGIISYDLSEANHIKPDGGSYLDVLDVDGKIITRFYKQWDSWPNQHIQANDKVVASGIPSTMDPVLQKAQGIDITMKNGIATFTFGPYGSVTAGPFNTASNWKKPKTLKLTFYSDKSTYIRIIDIQSLNFLVETSNTNTVPAAPTLTADDNANTLKAAHALGTSEILVSENNGTYVAYTAQINVGNVARAAGYWKFKIKSATGRDESAIVASPAFTVASTTPAAPTLVPDDSANTLSSTHALGTSEIVVSVNDGTYTAYAGTIAVGNVARAAGYWKFKIKSATGRNESAVISSPAFTVANVTPGGPTIVADDNANTLSASHQYGSDMVMSENGAEYVTYYGAQINVGNVARPSGYWKFKIKAATGRNESLISLSPAFTVNSSTAIVNTPAAPSLTADDNGNTLTATHTLGASEILMSVNSGTYTAYTGAISVGNVARAAGYWKFKIKAATGRNESAVVSSPAFTVTNTTPSAPLLAADDNNNTLTVSHSLGTSEILMSVNGGNYAAYTGTISVGNVARATGYWKFKIRSSTGRNESAVVSSPAFTVTTITEAVKPSGTTPEPPTLSANDNNDILIAYHRLGDSEILVSTNGGSYVAYSGQIYEDNKDRAAGYWKFKIRSATGRNESAVVSSPAFTSVTRTPTAPVIAADDNSNTLKASHQLGDSEILVSENNGTYVAYRGQISVGDVSRAAGYWKFKTIERWLRNESPVSSSPAFTASSLTTKTNTTPDAPTIKADDSANTLAASHALGKSEILVSENNAAFVTYTGTITVGNVARAANYWKFKIRAATGRNESVVVSSPAFTVKATAPVIAYDSKANTIVATHELGTSDILVSTNNGNYEPYTGPIALGIIPRDAGYWKFKVKPTNGMEESDVIESQVYLSQDIGKSPQNENIIRPDAPSIIADDDLNTLVANHELGASEILVSVNNAEFTPYTGKITVGNVDMPAGYWKFKIKEAEGRNESKIISSPVFAFNQDYGKQKFTIYPNPVENILQVQHDLVETSGSLEVVSLNSVRLKQVPMEVGTTFTSFDVSFLPNGIYLLVYKNGSERIVKRFIKK